MTPSLSPETGAPASRADDVVLHYTFPSDSPIPPTMPVEGNAVDELRRRLSLIETGLVASGAAQSLSDPDALYAASLMLALTYLRTMPRAQGADPHYLAVPYMELLSTQVAICACSDEVWAPREAWPHSKNAMLTAVLVNAEAAVLPAMRNLAVDIRAQELSRPLECCA